MTKTEFYEVYNSLFQEGFEKTPRTGNYNKPEEPYNTYKLDGKRLKLTEGGEASKNYYCPITAVTFFLKGLHYPVADVRDAAEALGLSEQDREDIITWADS